MDTMQVRIAGGFKVNANYKGFQIKADQPESAGGENSAPSPLDLFLASIGTCAGFFVASFCKERNILTDQIELNLEFIRNPQTHLVEKITINIKLPPEFPEKYKKAVALAAEQCTVKRTISAGLQFEVGVKAG
jgi:ribosomal protein S12 methylthiotransferase accessory factor